MAGQPTLEQSGPLEPSELPNYSGSWLLAIREKAENDGNPITDEDWRSVVEKTNRQICTHSVNASVFTEHGRTWALFCRDRLLWRKIFSGTQITDLVKAPKGHLDTTTAEQATVWLAEDLEASLRKYTEPKVKALRDEHAQLQSKIEALKKEEQEIDWRISASEYFEIAEASPARQTTMIRDLQGKLKERDQSIRDLNIKVATTERERDSLKEQTRLMRQELDALKRPSQHSQPHVHPSKRPRPS